MQANRGLEEFASTSNDMDRRLPNSRSRCFDIGIWGGCGVDCAAFYDGECTEHQEIGADEIIEEYSQEEAILIMEHYECFDEDIKMLENQKGELT